MKISRLLAQNIRLAIAQIQWGSIDDADAFTLLDVMDELKHNTTDIQRFREKMILVKGGKLKTAQNGNTTVDPPALPERKNDNDDNYEERLTKYYDNLRAIEDRISEYMTNPIEIRDITLSKETYDVLRRSGNPTWIKAKPHLIITKGAK